VTIDHENTIKSYSLSPSMLGRGHALLDPGGPVWVSLFPCFVVNGLITHAGRVERERVRLPPTTRGRLCGWHMLYDEWLARDTAWWLCCKFIFPCLGG
jgi:hypothetical protein